jgi:hypothetical protein
MEFLSLLLAKMQAVPTYYAWMFKQSETPEFRDHISPDSNPLQQREALRRPYSKQTRIFERISIGEFMMVLEKCRNLIVIDLRSDKHFAQFPVPTATVMRVRPHELLKVLEWIPADKTLVFCGASNFNTVLIESSPCMRGSAPLYVLEGDLRLMEVA